MRLSELSRRSGVSVATVKYYLREGLLPPGTPVTARQAEYGEEHVRRLRLIRALLTVGGMTISQARDVLAVAEDPAFSRHEQLGIAQYMLPPQVAPPDEDDVQQPEWDATHRELRALLAALDWRVYEEAPAINTLTRAVVTLRTLGYPFPLEDVRRYAEALHPMAREEAVRIEEQYPVLEEAIEAMVAYTMLNEPILLALRRLAHEDVTARLYGRGPNPGPDPDAGPDPAPGPGPAADDDPTPDPLSSS
ncbi:MerR family transcriptional regulator [Streptomyces sp. NPDC048604]|uniref:MerR family transcriptional regulator n=1 Tax=Streptomyces sp. NPDC048604 TaxID=3365578 RepID=UPI003715DD10